MHILQLANFYHPRSGGLRTTVDALCAGYVEAGHRVTMVVPGARRLFTSTPGCDVITVRSPKLPGSGGYRTIVDRSAVADLVASLRPDVIELSDKTTLARIVLGLFDRPPTVSRTRRTGRPTAVMVTRLSAEKHPEDAVRAIRLLHRVGRPVELVVVGDGPLRPVLEAEAADLPVQFTGHVVHRREIARFLGDADVAVAPSPHETFGLAALEALACGTPVVAASEGAVGELVVEGAGAVAPPGVNGIAAGIAGVLNGDRDGQRVAARGRAEQFPWSRTVCSMAELHAAVAGRSRPSLRAVS